MATEQQDGGLEAGTYEVLRTRLTAAARQLSDRAQALNARRVETFGSGGFGWPAADACALWTRVSRATSRLWADDCCSATTYRDAVARSGTCSRSTTLATSGP